MAQGLRGEPTAFGVVGRDFELCRFWGGGRIKVCVWERNVEWKRILLVVNFFIVIFNKGSIVERGRGCYTLFRRL